MEKKTLKCVLCDRPIIGYGNNAEPMSKGRCCDNCNATVVIPLRLVLGSDWRNLCKK